MSTFFWKGPRVLWVSHDGFPMGMIYENLHEWFIFYGFHVGKHTSPMDCMGLQTEKCQPFLRVFSRACYTLKGC